MNTQINYLLLLCSFFLMTSPSFGAGSGKKTTTQLLKGTWIHKQDGNMKTLRFIRNDTLVENKRGFIFNDSGKVIIYSEFGCQMPYPAFRTSYSTWKVKSKNVVIIDRRYPGEKPDRMRIIKLNDRILRFIWD